MTKTGHDVMFYEAFEEEAAALKRCMPRNLDALYTHHTIQESGDASAPGRIASVRTQSDIPGDWASELDAVLTRSTGYDHLTEFRARTGFRGACGCLPLYCARAVAEQAALLWMALLRRLPDQIRNMETFDRDGLTGGECRGRTLAVFGVGHIGSEVAAIGAGLGMTTLGVDPVRRHPDRVQYAEPQEALAAADVVVDSMNLTPHNRGYFNRDRWRCVRAGTVFVNVARGEHSPAADLLEALRNGSLAGVGMDVYAEEKHLAGYLRGHAGAPGREGQVLLELKQYPNVIFTPHNAFNTAEAVEKKAQQSVEQIVAFLADNRFVWEAPFGTA